MHCLSTRWLSAEIYLDNILRNRLPEWTALEGVAGFVGQIIGSSLSAGFPKQDPPSSVQVLASWTESSSYPDRLTGRMLLRIFSFQLILPVLVILYVTWAVYWKGYRTKSAMAPATPASMSGAQWPTIASIFLLVVSVACLCTGFSIWGNKLHFNMSVIIATLLPGAVLLLALIMQQAYLYRANPSAVLIPKDLTSREYTDIFVVCASILLLNGADSAVPYPLFLSTSHRS